MLLAEINGLAGGCVGLRPLDAQTCEMKRMYVKPDFRGKGIGRLLGEQIIQQAKERGYQSMRLDTADTMHAAQGLYRSLGFKQIHQYYNLPVDVLQRAVFMELSLESEEA
jgi:ribosomal protein S18 acetylase RimI-like enzyme